MANPCWNRWRSCRGANLQCCRSTLAAATRDALSGTPAAEESRADGRSRTGDPRFTRAVLWPSELRRHWDYAHRIAQGAVVPLQLAAWGSLARDRALMEPPPPIVSSVRYSEDGHACSWRPSRQRQAPRHSAACRPCARCADAKVRRDSGRQHKTLPVRLEPCWGPIPS